MIFKASYKPCIIFLLLPDKDFLCREIVEIKFVQSWLSCSEKNNNWVTEQFIRLVEILIYIIHFPESASSIPNRKKMF